MDPIQPHPAAIPQKVIGEEVPRFPSAWAGPTFILLFGGIFLSLKYLLGGLHGIQWAFALAVVGLYFCAAFTRKLVVIALPMAIYGLMYDFFTYIPFHWLEPIYVEGPYRLDLALFGIPFGQQTLLLNEFLFKFFSHPVLDVLTGVFYFLHVPMVLFLLLVLWLCRSPALAQRFTMAFLVINLLAFFTYFIFPAAAPWYVAKYGFLQPLGPVVGDAAGLVRFDQILGIDLFTTNYQISPVTLGAIPSMHAGFATLGCFYAFRVNKKLGSVFAVYVACMYFAALYLQHHYMIDAVLGSFYALLACLAVEWVFSERVGRINEKIWQCFYRDAARPLWIKNTARGK